MRISTKPKLLSEDDVRAEIQFGREMASRVLGRYGYYSNEQITRYVNLVAAALALNLNRPEISFRVAILKTDTINAYAAPGGYIFITRGALLQMHDEAELAAVIAHEMAHITNRHIVKELNIHASDTSPVSGFARFLGASGDPAKVTFMNMVDKAMDILFEDGYKLEDEKEADSSAALFLAMSGYDPSALMDYLDRIEELKGESMKVLEKTHPAFKERIELIKASIETEGLKEAGDNKRSEDRFNKTIAIKPHELTDDDVIAEVRFGREVAARLLGSYGYIDNEELTRYLSLVGMNLALNLNRPEIEFRVAVLDTDEVATFASPGGYIFITRGALVQVRDEAELAAAIAHEMAHVANKDMLREVNVHGTDKYPAAGFSRLVGTGRRESCGLFNGCFA
jgi:predicted Zn-dependent protease